jgi:hypothetical protein
MSSNFVTDDAPHEENGKQTQQTPVNAKENIKGVFIAGWVLAFLLPFVGVIINTWLVRNAHLYTYNKLAALAALGVSILCSFSLLFVLFSALYNFYSA